MHAAAGFLRERGVDLIVSNQMHPAWGAALRGAGFFQAPSNFLLAISPKLGETLRDPRGIHINRGMGMGRSICDLAGLRACMMDCDFSPQGSVTAVKSQCCIQRRPGHVMGIPLFFPPLFFLDARSYAPRR